MNPFTKKDVEEVLRTIPESRDNDLILANRLCDKHRVYVLLTDRVAIGNFITRIRRFYQQRGQYLPTSEKVKKRRGQLREACREEYRTSKREIQNISIQKVFSF